MVIWLVIFIFFMAIVYFFVKKGKKERRIDVYKGVALPLLIIRKIKLDGVASLVSFSGLDMTFNTILHGFMTKLVLRKFCLLTSNLAYFCLWWDSMGVLVISKKRIWPTVSHSCPDFDGDLCDPGFCFHCCRKSFRDHDRTLKVCEFRSRCANLPSLHDVSFHCLGDYY